MDVYSFSNVKESVKIVIWDLDETFWSGTLSEGGAEAIERNIEAVRTLVDRGIMCSICSKNDFASAKAELEKLGIYDLFVFPHIDWTPKGQAIHTMLERMGLRAENALFLDDNHMNLEEAAFFNEGIMCVDGRLDVTGLLALPQLKGKDDSKHSRLKQYKVMEGKFQEQADSGLSNEEFLRQSGIRIKIITDIDDKMDRVLELLNRTNQLNFTKVRANTPDERKALDELLATSGMHAGLIHVKDRYGDYGIVGFFCVRTKFSGTTVHHFAFSCRTLNMGVEQWVWQYLNKPEFKIVGPVQGELNPDQEIDWITEVTDFDADVNELEEKRLCLVGGCDLLQVSFYCGTNRDEFVNKQDDMGMLVRYDDVGFFLNPREMELKHSKPLREFVGWSLDDMNAFDRSLKESDLILLSLYFSVPGDNLFTFGGSEFGGKFWGTVPPRRFKRLMKDPDHAARFAKQMFHRRLPLEQRLEMTKGCFQHAYDLKQPDVPLFILGAASQHGEQAKRTIEIRLAFNQMCREFCDSHPGAIFVDLDELLDAEEFADSDHYTRTGYFKIAEFVNKKTDEIRSKGLIAEAAKELPPPAAPAPAEEFAPDAGTMPSMEPAPPKANAPAKPKKLRLTPAMAAGPAPVKPKPLAPGEKLTYDAFMDELKRRAANWSWSSNDRGEVLDVAFSTHKPFQLDLREPEVADWMRDAHKDGWTIEPLSCLVMETLVEMTGARSALDVGTHFGFISMFLLRLEQLEKVHGIEMNPGAVEAVMRHIDLPQNVEGLKSDERFQMHWCALSDKVEPQATVWYEGMRLSFEAHPRFTEAQMDVRSLSSIADEIGGLPDFIKIDIEGYEGKLVSDLDRLLDTSRPTVLLELHWDEVVEVHGTTRAAILDLFLSRGYSAARLNWHQKMPKQNFATEVTLDNAEEMLNSKNHAMYVFF